MNQAELIDAIPSKTGQRKTTTRQGLKGSIETLTETLTQGESVNIPGFGALKCV
jgi:nucleoid DNA-binding protein